MQQGVQPARQHGFARATASGDHHPAPTRIPRRQQQGQLQSAVAGDRRQGEGAGCGAIGRAPATNSPTGNRSACNHGEARALSRARQSR